MFRDPFGTCQMALIGPPCAPSVMIRIEVEDDPSDIAPISTVCIGGKHPDIAHGVLFVVRSQRRYIRGGVGTIRNERRALHDLTDE